jgi:hypothetical protein
MNRAVGITLVGVVIVIVIYFAVKSRIESKVPQYLTFGQ